jgi:glutamine amidotransferase
MYSPSSSFSIYLVQLGTLAFLSGVWDALTLFHSPSAPAHSLSKQVHEHYLPKLLSHDPTVHAEPTTESEISTRNRLFNIDGFGMSWYTPVLSIFSAPSAATKPDLHPALYKSIQPPLHDLNFRSICANTSSKVLFAHIRAATSTAITPTNNHPFTFGIHAIMHNGHISSFSKIKRKMCEEMSQEAYENIQGGTDTEHFAALFISYLCPGISARPFISGEDEPATPESWEEYHSVEEMKSALEQTIATIIKIQVQTLGSKSEPNDLNIAVTDGRSFVAYVKYFGSCGLETLSHDFYSYPWEKK